MKQVISDADFAELYALFETNKALKGPSFLLRSHWHKSNYRTMVRRGLVKWGNPPTGFSNRRFAGAMITSAGILAVRSKAKELVQS